MFRQLKSLRVQVVVISVLALMLGLLALAAANYLTARGHVLHLRGETAARPMAPETLARRAPASGAGQGCAGCTAKLFISTRCACQVFQCSVRYAISPCSLKRNTKQYVFA